MSIFWVKVIAICAIVASLVGFGLWRGHVGGYKAGYAQGVIDGADHQKDLDSAAVKQMQADAKSLLDQAKNANDTLALQYATLSTQWKVYHDKAEATNAALARDLSARTADNRRLRDNFAAAVGRAAGGSCPAAAPTAKADPGQREDVPAAAGGVLPADVDGLPPDPFNAIAILLRKADATLNVANECVAATR